LKESEKCQKGVAKCFSFKFNSDGIINSIT
jgi:hypothetical protein